MVDPGIDDKVTYFQAITGVEDLALCQEILEAHGWDLELAVSSFTSTSEPSVTSSGLDGGPSELGFAELGFRGETRVSNHGEEEFVPYPNSPGIVWKVVKLPFSLIRGSLGLISGAIGFGLWAAGGAFSYSIGALRWALGSQGNERGEENSSFVSLSSGAVEARAFIDGFESEYGEFHPNFAVLGFMESLGRSREAFKLLFVYLHSPDHPDTSAFCRDTLCAQPVVEFLNENFVCWGGSVRSSEGFKMSNSLRASKFPFCAVVMAASNQRIALLQQIEGPKSIEVFIPILQKVVEESGTVLVAARIEEEERRHDRRLREEQDAAYRAALEADQARERQRKEEQERLEREAAEAERKKKEEEEALAKAARETAEKEAALERRRQEKALSLGAEPEKGPDVTEVLVRFPTGERKERRFHSSATIHSLYDYVDSLNCLNAEKYSLVTNFPRVVYGPDKFDLSLKVAGLHPQVSLYVQVEDS
ncbi:hypothetical protein AMTRI_Chr11g95210 [Amborella trichopoda]|uniref:UBX domain-containing protein n=1 Tax=Amborella trichopoda TaxID=13333 RepID=U5D6Y6_AMBTC|nr:plant UBX domain-containing protein 10 [Amborella trichopoda]ERN16103.1 hypothetical protein AMTR_s00030p00184390 [Amborella trichopoda]|eukprot:XP_006854636.1 plant UBX domain-containing protein 10 [Amborella trichopoda]